MANRKDVPTRGGHNVFTKALKMIKNKSMSLGNRSSKISCNALTAINLDEFDGEKPLEATPEYGSAPTLPVSVDKAWLTPEEYLSFLFPSKVLDTGDSMRPFLEAPFIPMERVSR